MFGTDIQAFANFNITAGAGAVGTVGSSATASIVDAGNGWYRCIIVTASATASAQAFILLVSSATAARFESWTTAGTESIYLWGAQLEQRSAATAYTPTTTQPITNYIPVLETAASGVARFDHNPTTFESLGLLIEEQRTNLFTYSEQFDNAAWAVNNCTISANTLVAPDGTLTADKLVENNGTGAKQIFRNSNMSVTSGVTYSWSLYFKAGERTKSYVSFGVSAFGSCALTIDLTAITVVASGTNPPTNLAIVDVGNGWRRVSCAVLATATVSSSPFAGVRPSATNGDLGDYTGNGFSGIYLWGAQLEAGAFPTSYIPTVASQVTRASDAAVMTGTNFSDWYNQAAGTLYAEVVSAPVNNIAQQSWNISDGTTNNTIFSRRNTVGSVATAVLVGGVSQGDVISGAAISAGATYKSAFAYKVNDLAISTNSATVAADTSATIPVVNRITIGSSVAAVQHLNGTIKKLAYYPIVSTATQLQALTS
jgi:hypothetical protein